MASRRMISASIFADEWFGPLAFFDQTLWIGLFAACADDQGRMQDNAYLIRAICYPYKDIPIADIEAALQRFADAGKILRYEANGKHFIQLVNWWEHQQPQWAAHSKAPAPDGWSDRVRTRLNGKYIETNWRQLVPGASPEPSPEPSPEGEANVHLSGQYPVPVPVPIINNSVGEKSPTHTDAPAKKDKPRRKGRHPLSGLWHENTGAWPNKVQEDAIIKVVTDSQLFAHCIQTAALRGVSPRNVELVLKWYREGGPPSNGKQQAPPPATKREKQRREYEFIDPMSGERRKAEALV